MARIGEERKKKLKLRFLFLEKRKKLNYFYTFHQVKNSYRLSAEFLELIVVISDGMGCFCGKERFSVHGRNLKVVDRIAEG